MTELIVDAIEFVKNPYKGKKLKVRAGPGSAGLRTWIRMLLLMGPGFISLMVLFSRLTLTSPRSP